MWQGVGAATTRRYAVVVLVVLGAILVLRGGAYLIPGLLLFATAIYVCLLRLAVGLYRGSLLARGRKPRNTVVVLIALLCLLVAFGGVAEFSAIEVFGVRLSGWDRTLLFVDDCVIEIHDDTTAEARQWCGALHGPFTGGGLTRLSGDHEVRVDSLFPWVVRCSIDDVEIRYVKGRSLSIEGHKFKAPAGPFAALAVTIRKGEKPNGYRFYSLSLTDPRSPEELQ